MSRPSTTTPMRHEPRRDEDAEVEARFRALFEKFWKRRTSKEASPERPDGPPRSRRAAKSVLAAVALAPFLAEAGSAELTAAVAAHNPAARQAVDADVNAIYDRMSAAYAARDPAALARVYARDALVFPSQANAAPVIGHERIEKGPGSFLAATKAKGGALDIRFRVTARRLLGESALDTGVYRLTVTDAAGNREVQVGKFMTVAARGHDGRWSFVADTDTPMPASAWNAAKPHPGAKFDS